MPQPKPRLPAFLQIGIVILLSLGTFLLTHPLGVSSSSASALTGLVRLRAMAQESVPYEQAIASGKPSFVEFYADWCTTCQAMASTLQPLHQQYADQVNFVMLNVDDPRWEEPVQQYQVRGVPQFTFLEADQSVVQSFVGSVPRPVLAQVFEQLSTQSF